MPPRCSGAVAPEIGSSAQACPHSCLEQEPVPGAARSWKHHCLGPNCIQSSGIYQSVRCRWAIFMLVEGTYTQLVEGTYTQVTACPHPSLTSFHPNPHPVPAPSACRHQVRGLPRRRPDCLRHW